ncbi:Mut7-C RNAse domain-containing protein [Nitrosomonas halophila]|uniref:Twitching motility protein PilT n=1 Tax=Nitrosomonas halophila TaxID=44576 RepID=A0A1H3NLG4_9PROT|nr:Mut7-C RNAse domain-containing protein [Nitrosomonas halophila]SDY89265.1 hypothetical protein SAMN05421881_10759 [Nitrosomonas halophila]HRQ05281.1 Mut7-C RNAse domain-containing protein [Nitrosomonas halophila]
MAQITIHFHHILNDFLAPAYRHREIVHRYDRKASVKDMIESFNVPHTEVERIVVNGQAVDFSYLMQDGDHIQVYPASANPGVPSPLPLRPEPPSPPRFIVDTNLGRLARYLRLLGLDCLYHNDYADAVIAQIASAQQRTVLTRDRSLLRRSLIVHGYFVRSDMPKTQVREVLARFDLYRSIDPLTRCTRCNGKLTATDKHQIAHRLEPLTKKYYDKFLSCPDCGQIYWQGSHFERVMQLIGQLLSHPKQLDTRRQ